MLHYHYDDLFVTWRLKGTLPRKPTAPIGDLAANESFAWFDRLLDSATFGPSWLRRPEIAETVVQALQYGESELRHYHLHAYVVMPNHVHMLVTPHVDLSKMMDSLAASTTEIANQILERSGGLWHNEIRDYKVNAGEFEETRLYIERNPVNAALASEPCLYPWSSAARKGHVPVRLAEMFSVVAN